ncbi:MAG TPA: dihydrofolate reductase family protein [Ktedonobacterales bacterium]|jgi:dihydrofolate reductase|nr:dihydrofolate reductase family protein [Ktedonobacterales bacterium]
MGNIVLTQCVTLDGVMEDPGGQNTFKDSSWHFPFWSEDARKWKHEELFKADAYLLGRRTYEEFAGAWPHITDETGFADRMNSMPKYVVSTTLSEVGWINSRLIKGNVAQAVAALKQEVGRDILVAGSGQVVGLLEQHDLINEYRLLVHPIVVGRGATFFKDLKAGRTLKLVETKPFAHGIVLLCYQPA